MQNKRILVCRRCLDNMQSQLRAITLPGDPPPILNPRPENHDLLATERRIVENADGVTVVTGLQVPEG